MTTTTSEELAPTKAKLNSIAISSGSVAYLIIPFALFGFLLSVTHFFGASPDYIDYEGFFSLVRIDGFYDFERIRFEPGFSVASILLTELFSSDTLIYSLFVLFAMLLKGFAITKLSASKNIFLFVAVFYFFRYFSLHEYTQLRVACATSLTLFGFSLLATGENRRAGILGISAATLFHYSSITIFPAIIGAYFVKYDKAVKPLQVILLGFGAFLFISFVSEFILNFASNFFEIVNVYQDIRVSDIAPNRFAVQLLIDWFLIFISLFNWESLSLSMKRVLVIELVGMAIFYGSTETAVVAHRVREFYSVLWVVFVAEGLRRKGTDVICFGFIVASLIWYGYIYFIRGDFFS